MSSVPCSSSIRSGISIADILPRLAHDRVDELPGVWLGGFSADQVGVRFAAADHPIGLTLDEDLRSPGPGVVIRCLDEAVRACRADGNEVAGHDVGHMAIAGEEIA